MEQPQPLDSVMAGEVRARRDALGLTAQQLADRVSAMGGRLSRQAISKVENGDRALAVDELLLLARALRIPPLLLIFPFDRRPEVQVLPDVAAPAWDAAAWFAGQAPFPFWSQRALSENAPEPDGKGDQESFEQGAVAVELWDTHTRLLSDWKTKVRAADIERRRAAHLEEDERDANQQTQVTLRRQADSIASTLWDVRRRMRQHGILAPELPEELQDIDADVSPLQRVIARAFEAQGGDTE